VVLWVLAQSTMRETLSMAAIVAVCVLYYVIRNAGRGGRRAVPIAQTAASIANDAR